MSNKLKPCPFCGHRAKTYVGKIGIEVRCTNPDCGIRTPAFNDISIIGGDSIWSDELETSLEKCIRIWNSRLEGDQND